jgi:hypothetical protein
MQNGVHQEMLNNKIDAFSRGLQATTVACAKCHDHKLDAVSQKDYYGLAGVFMSGRWVTNTLDTPQRNRETIAHLRELKRELRKEIGRWWSNSGMGILPMFQASGHGQDAHATGATGEEDPLHPWQKISSAQPGGRSIRQAWEEQQAAYAKLRADRVAANARDFVVIADFSRGLPPGWTTDGVGLADGPMKSGDFTVALEGDAVVGRILPAGLFTDSLSPRLNGALRSPFLRFEIRHSPVGSALRTVAGAVFGAGQDSPQKSAAGVPTGGSAAPKTAGGGTGGTSARSVDPTEILSVDVAGGDFSAERIIVDNAFLTERQTYLTSAEPTWRSIKDSSGFAGRSVYVEYATKSSNPNFPPRWGLGKFLTNEMIEDPRSWFGVTRVVSHVAAGKPADELGRFVSLFDGVPPESMDEAKERYARWFNQAIRSWMEDRADDEQVRLLGWLLEHKFLPNAAPPAAVAKLLSTYRETEKRLLDPQTANGMAECDPPIDFPLQIRGDYDRLGAPVPRGYLEFFGCAPVSAQSSGRRELAEFVASSADPLTARVYVNRVWQWIFGAALVGTPDDFGHLGEKPSNPELLDYVASWFMENGWSTRKLIRLMVTSETFRQSGQEDPAAMRTDPQNRMLHHYALRRLEAESIRDAILSVSGRLDARLFGPPVNPFRHHEDLYKRLFTGPLDGNGRRSIYTTVSIMEPSEFLAVFNQPAPKIPTGKRDVTNVPAQSLALLNDPFVIAEARGWGAALAGGKTDTNVKERLRGMFRTALGRFPTAEELARWSALVETLAADHGVAEKQILADTGVWKDVAHTLFNVKEFIYVR